MENWKLIEGYNDYMVSDTGRVRSIKYGKSKVLKERISKRNKPSKKANQHLPYIRVVLYRDRKRKEFFVHRLVAQAFVENPENKNQVDHINNDVSDNRAENLQWVTCSENVKRTLSYRRERVGEENNKSRFITAEILEIRRLFEKEKLPKREIARRFNTYNTVIREIVNRKTWKHI